MKFKEDEFGINNNNNIILGFTLVQAFSLWNMQTPLRWF